MIEIETLQPRLDRGKGIWASLTGILVMVGGFALTSACCWLPPLVISFGLSTAVASTIGGLEPYAWLIFGFGTALMAGGIGWMIWRWIKHPASTGECCPK